MTSMRLVRRPQSANANKRIVQAEVRKALDNL